MLTNKGSVYISGGGSAPETHVIDEHFVKSLQNRKILYIPIGLKRTLIGYEGCYEWINEALQRYSKLPLTIEMWVNLKKLTFSHLKSFEAIYIGGANSTNRLMDLLEEFNIAKLLIKYVYEGGTIYGGSSGGVILGKNINTSKNEKENRKGLGLILDYSIKCHLNLNADSIAQNIEGEKILPLIALPENSGILYKSNKLTVLGLSKIQIISAENLISVIKPGEIVNI